MRTHAMHPAAPPRSPPEAPVPAGDETAASIVEDGRIISSEVSSSVEFHSRYGGVVPELASRDHLRKLLPLLRKVLDETGGQESIQGIAYTSGPGLVGALLVGAAVVFLRSAK